MHYHKMNTVEWNNECGDHFKLQIRMVEIIKKQSR